jgi:hypothetical protein
MRGNVSHAPAARARALPFPGFRDHVMAPSMHQVPPDWNPPADPADPIPQPHPPGVREPGDVPSRPIQDPTPVTPPARQAAWMPSAHRLDRFLLNKEL